jgi:hypothetical protein
MSKLAHSHPDHELLTLCGRCGCTVYQDEVSVEAFELLDEIVCTDCAEVAFEDNGQFGVGA